MRKNAGENGGVHSPYIFFANRIKLATGTDLLAQNLDTCPLRYVQYKNSVVESWIDLWTLEKTTMAANMPSFAVHDESFKTLLGSSPKLEMLLENKEYPFAHEAGVFIRSD